MVCRNCLNFKRVCVQSSGLASRVSVQFYNSAFEGEHSLVFCLCVRGTGYEDLPALFCREPRSLGPGVRWRKGCVLHHGYGSYLWALTPEFADSKYMPLCYLGKLKVKNF